METKFTKGGWVLHRVSHDITINGEVHVVASEGYPSAFIPSWIDHKETAIEAMANAHLIAAAPEMYEEIEMDVNDLIDLLSTLERYSDDYLFYECKLERKQFLLSKARGEQ